MVNIARSILRKFELCLAKVKEAKSAEKAKVASLEEEVNILRNFSIISILYMFLDLYFPSTVVDTCHSILFFISLCVCGDDKTRTFSSSFIYFIFVRFTIFHYRRKQLSMMHTVTTAASILFKVHCSQTHV